MSARDDATTATNGPRAARAGARVSAAVLLGACLGAAVAGVLAERFAPDRQPRYEARVRWDGGPPQSGEWPRPARPGENAVGFARDGREWLTVRSFSAAGVEALARDLQRRRLSGVDAAAARRAAARAQWRAAETPGTLPPLSPAGECAALVRGRLLLVVLTDRQASATAPLASPAQEATRTRLERAEAEVVRLALSARPDSLARALTACAAAEGDWLRAQAEDPVPGPRAGLAAAWLWHERLRAPVLDRVERTLESSLTKSEGAAVVAAAYGRALALERLGPDPAAVLFVHGAWGDGPEVVPVAGTWLWILAAGALAGALAGAGIGRFLRRLLAAGRPRRRGAPGRPGTSTAPDSERSAARGARQAWDADLGWLHVVSGPDRARIAHAAGILSGSFLQRGQRVLLVDAGRTLRLHERFGGETRWGLGECLAGEVPLLGAVQAAGRAGFFFLAHGAPASAVRWDEMSRLLEAARAHFGRVVLALEPGTPRAAALPLGGRVLEAWWADPGPDLPRGGVLLSERLGIPFVCLNLDWLTQVMHEDRGAAAQAESPAPETGAGVREVEALPEVAAVASGQPPPGAELAAAVEAGPPPADPSGVPVAAGAGPVVLGCDVEIRERLRFLIWMRRVQAEGRLTTLATGARG